MYKKLGYITKILFFILSFHFFSFLYISKIKAEVIGNIYPTDILAYIDDIPIESYNIGGKTAIVLEDLENYGFSVIWKEDIRKLIVSYESYFGDNSTRFIENQITKESSNKTVAKIYSTDIVAFVNGFEIPSYNIGGKTAACIEDLGNIDTEDNQNKQFGYSKYILNSVWNPSNRTISLNTFKSNLYELGKLCIQNNIVLPSNSSMYNLHFKYIDAEDYSFPFFFSLDETKYKNRISGCYSIELNGKKIENDVPFVMSVYIDDGFNTDNLFYYNIDMLKDVFEKENLENPFIPPLKEDIIKSIEKTIHTTVLNKTTIDNCAYVLCFSYGTIDRSSQLIKIDNNANIYTYPNATTYYDLTTDNQKVYYTDKLIGSNRDNGIEKDKNEKINLYCLDFDAKKISQIYSDYGIRVSSYYPDYDLGTDIIQIQNSDGETIDLKLSDLIN